MKKSLALITPALAYLTLASPSFAINLCTSGTYSALCAFNVNNMGSLISNLIMLIFAIAIIAALLYLIWGGFKWLTSGGDKNAVASARDHIIAAIIGLVIIFLSYLILNIIVQFFGLGDLTNITVPNLNGQPIN
jgi:hypothetical protein